MVKPSHAPTLPVSKALDPARTTTRARVELFGCAIDPVTEDEAVRQILRWTGAPTEGTRHVLTVNVAIAMMARHDARLARAIERADLVVADGAPLVWASRWLDAELPERVTGVDLMERLLAEGEDRGLSVFLLGTTQERLETLVHVLERRFPRVAIKGARNGFFRPKENAKVARHIRSAGADLLLVGMPAPFKEIWCEAHRDELGCPVVLGVGGAFDVLGGYVPRAPEALQGAGLEWAWRLAMEPRKLWKRYLLTNSAFVREVGGALAGRASERLRRGVRGSWSAGQTR